DFLDRADDVLLRLPLRPERVELLQRERGHHRPGPRPEVLRRELLPADLAEVLVDVRGTDVANLVVVVHVLEEVLPGEVAAALHDPRELRILKIDLAPLSAFSDELEAHGRATDPDVPVLERGEAVASVLLRV